LAWAAAAAALELVVPQMRRAAMAGTVASRAVAAVGVLALAPAIPVPEAMAAMAS
jgi:hypothetical protein